MSTDVARGQVYRTFWRRLGAGIIDGLVFMPIMWIDSWLWSSVSSPVLLVPWFLVSSLSFIMYSILLHGFFGQTLGKRFTGVKVLDLSGSKLTMRQAFMRDCVYLVFLAYGMLIDLPSVASGVNPYNPETFRFSDLGIAHFLSMYASVIWFALELISMLSNPRRRALHDFIAGSVVVRLENVEQEIRLTSA